MTARSFALICVICAGCLSPLPSGQARCASDAPRCPDAYYCASDDKCWRDGDGPDAAVGDDMAAVPTDMACAHVLCEHFDSPAIDTSIWQVINTLPGSWTLAQEDGVAFGVTPAHGARALHVHEQAITASVAPTFTLNTIRGLPLSRLYLRYYIYLTASYPSAPPNAAGVTLYSLAGKLGVNISYYAVSIWGPWAGSAIGSPSPVGSLKLNLNQWHCIEAAFDLEAPDGGARVDVDGVPDPALAFTLPSSPITSMNVIDEYGDTGNIPDVEFWIDELVIDSSPIGCAF
jgi:hypothetical protein